jgi:hypothetical protein
MPAATKPRSQLGERHFKAQILFEDTRSWPVVRPYARLVQMRPAGCGFARFPRVHEAMMKRTGP